MSDNLGITITVAVVFLCGAIMVSMSEYSDIRKADAGLQQCYVKDRISPVWMKVCP